MASRRQVRESLAKRIASSIRSGFSEVWRNNMGKAGLIIIFFIVIISIYALATLPPGLPDKWKNRLAWSEYPTSVPPEWIKYFGVPVAEHKVYTDPKLTFSGIVSPKQAGTLLPFYANAVGSGQQMIFGYVQVYSVKYELRDPAFPTGILVLFKPINNSVIIVNGVERVVQVLPILVVSRPDGLSIVAAAESSALKITDLAAKNLTVTADLFWRDYVEYYKKQGIDANLTPVDARSFATQMLFGRPVGPKQFEPVTGTYNIHLMLVYIGRPDVIEQAIGAGQIGFEGIKIVVKGSAYGISGTDNMGRDLWLAVLYGFPVALAVGLFAAVTSVLIGLVVGVISGYYGGIIDEIIQRVIDVLSNIPILPILILIGVILQEKPGVGPWEKLFIIIGFLVILGWGNTAIIVRSMTLSIKAEPYIDAAKAIGASNARIVFRHIIPQILPYAMASLVFSVPGAIITEAGLSVLGIEHGLPTWGKVLADAQANRGVAYKMWWWILPPGVMLAITGLAFVLLGLAIETIVEPRLRRR